MPYAVLDNIQGLLPHFPISLTSKPNMTQVQSYIDNTEGEINSALGVNGLLVPVGTPTYFLEELEALATMGSAARTMLAAFPSESGPNSTALGPTLWRTYQARLAEIRKGIGLPQVAISTSEISFPRDYFTDLSADGTDGEIEDAWGHLVYSSPNIRFGKVW